MTRLLLRSSAFVRVARRMARSIEIPFPRLTSEGGDTCLPAHSVTRRKAGKNWLTRSSELTGNTSWLAVFRTTFGHYRTKALVSAYMNALAAGDAGVGIEARV